MLKQPGSYRSMTKRETAQWLDPWKKEGILLCVPHREPPNVRIIHNFRRVVKDEGKEGVELHIRWYPWVCWEADEYYKLRRVKKGKERPHAEYCPICRTVEYFEARDDLAADAPLFELKAGKDKRTITKADFIGVGEGKDSFQDDVSGKTEFIFKVISLRDVEKGVCLTNEKWSLGQ